MSPDLNDSPGDRMNTHNNARLTPKGREDMVRAVVERGLSKAAAARQFNTTTKTLAKWVARFKAEGVDGLRDRSSRPLSSPNQTASATCAAIEALRITKCYERPVNCAEILLVLVQPLLNLLIEGHGFHCQRRLLTWERQA